MTTVSITASALETAAATFFSALLGYIASAGFVLSQAVLSAGLVVGGIAALGTLGYHALSGNTTKTA